MPPRNRADQSCISYRTSDGQRIPIVAVEYKPPHKLSIEEVAAGLKSEIETERDVINQVGKGFPFNARRLTAAIVTQLFSYMVGKSIQYGYVCTGQAFVFLHVPDDPSIVYYSVCVPKVDVVDDDDETRLHRTAVAQVFAFILQALRSRPPPESWHDEADRLGIWPVEYDDILNSIPPEERNGKKSPESLHKPWRWKGFERSPIRTRSKSTCQKQGSDETNTEDEDSPSPSPDSCSGKLVSGPAAAGTAGKRQAQDSTTKQDIQSRPFCTQLCLKGLAHGGQVDRRCPNLGYHGEEHIDRHSFLPLIQDQLAKDRGRDADCVPMNRRGARGSLFTVIPRLYARSQGGRSNIELVRPCHSDGGIYFHFMFLAWAGRPLFECSGRLEEAVVTKGVARIFGAMHNLRVLHRDAEPRNVLCDESGALMAIDLERAEYRGRQPLGQVSHNGQIQKGNRGTAKAPGRDEFAQELKHAVEKCCRSVRSC